MSAPGGTATTAATRDAGGGGDLRNLARGSILNLLGSFVAASLNLVLPVVVTRNFASQDAGAFFQCTALFLIVVNAGTLGADTGLLRALPRSIALGRPRELRRYLGIAFGPPLALSIVVAAALVLLAGPLAAAASGGSAATAQTLRGAFYVVAPLLPVAVAYVIALSMSRGLGPVKPLVVVDKLGRGVLQTGAVWTAVTVTSSVGVVALAWAAPYVALLVAIGVWIGALMRRRLRAPETAGPADRPHERRSPLAGEFWRFAGPRAVSRLFTVALQRFDILLVGALRGPTDAAIYTAATRFPILGLMFVQAIQQVMAPRISEMLALGDGDRLRTIFRTTTAWLTLISWPIYLISIIFAGLLLDVFGDGYDRGAVAVMIICSAMLVATACGPVDSVLLMGGRSTWSLLNSGLALAVTVGLDLLLVPTLGVMGAALGWAAGILVKNLLALWQVHRFMGLQPFDSAVRTAMALAVASFGLVPAACVLLVGAGLVGLLLAGVTGSLVFLAGVARARDRLEVSALTAALARRRTRKAEYGGADVD